MHHGQVEFIPIMQHWFNIQKSTNHINQLKKKNHIIISMYAEQELGKNQMLY